MGLRSWRLLVVEGPLFAKPYTTGVRAHRRLLGIQPPDRLVEVVRASSRAAPSRVEISERPTAE